MKTYNNFLIYENVLNDKDSKIKEIKDARKNIMNAAHDKNSTPIKRLNNISRILQGLSVFGLFKTVSKTYDPLSKLLQLKYGSIFDVDNATTALSMATDKATSSINNILSSIGFDANLSTTLSPNFDDAKMWLIITSIIVVLLIISSILRKGGSFKNDINKIMTWAKSLFTKKKVDAVKENYYNCLIIDSKLYIELNESNVDISKISEAEKKLSSKSKYLVNEIMKRLGISDWNSEESKNKRNKIANELSNVIVNLSQGLKKMVSDEKRYTLIYSLLNVGTVGSLVYFVYDIVNLEFISAVTPATFALFLYILKIILGILRSSNVIFSTAREVGKIISQATKSIVKFLKEDLNIEEEYLKQDLIVESYNNYNKDFVHYIGILNFIDNNEIY